MRSASLGNSGWHFIKVAYVARTDKAQISFNILAWSLPARASIYLIAPRLALTPAAAAPLRVVATPAPTPTSPSSLYRRLTFYDNFAGTTLDAAKWNVNKYALNYEMSENVAKNVVVDNGLSMITKKETSPKGKPWTSSYIDTKNKFQQKYGYFEVCVWVPQYAGTSAGLWDAPLWLRSTDGTKGEIDVAELWGDRHNGYATQTYPTGGGFTSLLADTNHADNRKSSLTIKPGSGRLSDGYHRIGLEWSPNSFTTYLDGKPIGTIPSNELGVAGGSSSAQPFSASVFGPMHLRVQRQVGQLRNSYPDLTPGYWGVPDANTQPYSAMKIKYVAVYSG